MPPDGRQLQAGSAGYGPAEPAVRDQGEASSADRAAHARNLEQCFQALGAEPQAQQLRDLFDAEAQAKTEHLEIGSYRGMIMMAQQMGEQQCAQLLQENCRQEEQALQQLESMQQQLAQEMSAR